MNEFKYDIDLVDLLIVLWKRKWLIIIPTFLLVFAVGLYSFLSPKVWKIDAIILPSKYIIQIENAPIPYTEIVVVDPKQIAEQISNDSYNNLIAAKLNIDVRKIPKITAENPKDTHLLIVTTKEKDVEAAKLILFSLFELLKNELDTKANIEINGIESQIKSNEIEKIRVEKEIETFKNMLNLVKQRMNNIEKEMSEARIGIASLQKEQQLNLKKQNRGDSESLAMLLYSNEIQASLRYYNSLNELLSTKKFDEENIKLEIKNSEEKIKAIENAIDNLKTKKGRIDLTQLFKEPTCSLNPVSPKKKLNILITGILSLAIFTMLALFIENLEKRKSKIGNK